VHFDNPVKTFMLSVTVVLTVWYLYLISVDCKDHEQN